MVVDYGGTTSLPVRPVGQALRRGFLGRCPACGKGAVFSRYISVNDSCPDCREELLHQRADDAPPYLTIMVVGHVVVPLALALEQARQPEIWVHWILWLPLTLVLSLVLLPRFKGMMVALQWALRMHGFGGPHEEGATEP